MFGSALYLDLGETRVRILKGAAGKGTLRIDGYADLQLEYPLGADLDDERNHEIGRRIAGFLQEQGLSSRRVSLLISREGIITRNARVPALARKVLDEFLHAAINEFLPVDLSEYAYDYRIMRSYRDEGDGGEYHDLLLAAVPRYMVEQALQIVETTKMYVKSVDILPNSLYRLFSPTNYHDVAVLDVSRDGSRLVVCEDGSLWLYADIPFHLAEMKADPADFQSLVEETRGYLNFFAARHQGRQVEALHVVGDLARREEAVTILGGALEIPVKTSLDGLIACRWGDRADRPPGSLTATLAGNLGMMLRKD